MSTKRELLKHLPGLRAQGFDLAHITYNGRNRAIRPQCSQCDVLVINGIPAHERGCPNQRHECRGCNATVARSGQYCEDCS